jgi:hypothetical protein
MVGKLIGEDRGQITSTRVLPTESGQGPKVENSFEAKGTILGIHAREVATYWAVSRPDGARRLPHLSHP